MCGRKFLESVWSSHCPVKMPLGFFTNMLFPSLGHMQLDVSIQLPLDDKMQAEDIMGWPKCSFGFSISMYENTNELFGQPSTFLSFSRGLLLKVSVSDCYIEIRSRPQTSYLANSKVLFSSHFYVSLIGMNHTINVHI